MTKAMQNVLRYATLTLITIVAVGVMAWVSMRDDDAALRARQQVTAPVPVVAQPKPLVAVESVEPSLYEVTATYSGKIEPWETYTLGFEIAGRAAELGTDADGRPLDDGSRVTEGQMLARLDDQILQARRAEASAQLEQASSDLQRAREVRESGLRAITEAEFQQALTQHALAKAALEIATENLEDATIYAPVDGTIVERLAKPGESVTANAAIFDLVEDHQVLLTVDVPEARIRELQSRMRTVRQAQASKAMGDPEARVFRARVQLETRDRFGRPLPAIDAQVHRLAEMADPRTGLFEVEIVVPNDERLLRPGMVATAEIVVDRISAYRVPENAVLYRADETYVFSLVPQPETLKVMFWDVGDVPVATAVRIPLTKWIDQGGYLLVPSTSVELDRIIVRGQQRLSDGQHVRVAEPGDASEQQELFVPDRSDEDRSVAKRPPPGSVE